MEYDEPVLWLILVDVETGVKTMWTMETNVELAVEKMELLHPGRVIGYYDEDDNYIKTRIIND
jgi:hypothetical protein